MTPDQIVATLIERRLIPADHPALTELLRQTAVRVHAAPPVGDLCDAVARAFEDEVWTAFATQDPAPEAIERAVCQFANHPYGPPLKLKLAHL